MKSMELPSIVRLPLEVLEVFIQLSPVASQLSIARVSRLFHSLTVRPLYRDIFLGSKRAVVSCCRTLVSNDAAARTVRTFRINYTYYSSSHSILSAYYSLITKALQALSGLRTIKLLVHDPYFVTLLRHGIFPTLSQFECYLTPSPGLIEFLNRHPRINYLQVSPNEDTSGLSTNDSSLPALALSGLQYFAGNVQSVPFLCAASSLRAAIISWNAMDIHPDLAFSTLQQSSRHSLGLLSCRRRGWNLDLIETISIRLPDVVSLHITNILLVDSRPTETYLQAIRCFLPRFTQLQRLKINCIDYWEMGDISCQIDQDFSTVTEWGDACSSLIEITLPHSDELVWYRMSKNVWIPDPKHTAGGAWLYDRVVLKRHPEWRTIVEALQGTLSEPLPALRGDSTETIAGMRNRLDGLLQARMDETTPYDGEGPKRKRGGDIPS